VVALPSALSPEELAPSWRETPVLCVAGRGSLDEAAATMLAQLLEKHGIGARVVPPEAVSVANLVRLDVTGAQMACLSYPSLEPGSFTNARYLVRRLRRRLPQAKIFAGFWTLTAQDGEERDALAATRADLVVTSLRQAVEQVVNAAKGAAGADLEGDIRAPAVAPLAAASGHSVAEFPVLFDPSQRPKAVHEEARSQKSPYFIEFTPETHFIYKNLYKSEIDSKQPRKLLRNDHPQLGESTRREKRFQRAFPDVDVDDSESKTRPMTGISQ
jgi:hypothetical protein